MGKLCALFSTIALLLITNILKAQKIELLEQGKRTSIRGLSVVNDKVAWISGSAGYIAITTDGGKTWAWQQAKGYEKADFRDIEAFSDKEAIIMSSGTPALILKTTDGGNTWNLKYQNDDKAYFLDAMDFANKKHGFILGDPISNKFLVLETNDAGETWHSFKSRPDALPGEAAFAASGTCLRVDEKSNITIATGGKIARCLNYKTNSSGWITDNLPITHGPESNGAFSITANQKIIVGGNYSKDKLKDSVSCLVDESKRLYILSSSPPAGYQSCVEQISNQTYLATGTPGTNISTDGGLNWTQMDTNSFNVCRKAKKGNLVLLAGDRGKIGVFKP